MRSILSRAPARQLVQRRCLATPVSSLDGSLLPRIVTDAVPGPKGIEASNSIASFQDNRTHVLVCGEYHFRPSILSLTGRLHEIERKLSGGCGRKSVPRCLRTDSVYTDRVSIDPVEGFLRTWLISNQL